MTVASDSVVISAGSGNTIATHTLNSKEHQVFVAADPSGHIAGTRQLYVFDIAPQVHVAAANTVFWDLFNADATAVVRVLSIRLIPDVVTAVTGVAFQWTLNKTSAVGTGGTAQTAWMFDTSQSSINANVTCRLKPTGGATSSATLRTCSVSSEETNTGTLAIAGIGGLEWVPDILRDPVFGACGIVLRQNQGIRMVQVTNSAAGNTGFSILLSVE